MNTCLGPELILWYDITSLRHGWEEDVKMDLQDWDVGVWTGLIWLWIWTVGGNL